jgi:hypothetical protein
MKLIRWMGSRGAGELGCRGAGELGSWGAGERGSKGITTLHTSYFTLHPSYFILHPSHFTLHTSPSASGNGFAEHTFFPTQDSGLRTQDLERLRANLRYPKQRSFIVVHLCLYLFCYLMPAQKTKASIRFRLAIATRY